MNDAVRANGLARPQVLACDEQRAGTAVAQSRQRPQAGDGGADNGDVDAQSAIG